MDTISDAAPVDDAYSRAATDFVARAGSGFSPNLIGAAPPPAPDWSFIDPSTLQGRVIAERDWLSYPWIGTGFVTTFYSPGGFGKSTLLQQLMTSCSTSKPWIGQAVSRCKTLGLFCEDDGDELHRRQDAINQSYGIDFDDLEDMRWATGVGKDNTLVTFGYDGCPIETPAFAKLRKEAFDFQARLIVVDTAADTFGGDENNRRQVRQFIGATLGKLALDLQAAVILSAHPSRSGMKVGGDMDGGSTAWSNTSRARLALTKPAGDDDDSQTDERVLSRRKANYASAGDAIRLRWQRGVLVAIDRPGQLAAASQQADADFVFLRLLAAVDEANMPVSASHNAHNFAPKIFASRPDRQGFSRRDFEQAMSRLIAAGKINLDTYGRKGDERRRLVAGKAADNV